MAAPTYAQIMAELALWKANPNQRYINGQKLVDLLSQYINHLTNNGAYDPGTFMQQVVGVIGTYPDRFSSLSVTVYVNQATGNDNNSGMSNSSPVKSLSRVSEIINGKFHTVYIFIEGNYRHSTEVLLQAWYIKIRTSANATFTFAKRAIPNAATVGECTTNIVFEGYSIGFEGNSTGNIVVESNAGYISGDSYWSRHYYGAIQAGNQGIAYYPAIVSFNVYNSIQVGNNCALACGRTGLNHNDSKPRFEFNFNYINSWSQGSNAFIAPYAYKTYYRKSLLFDNATSWKKVGNAAELCLQTGMYAVRVHLSTFGVGGQVLGSFSGLMTWFNEGTNDVDNEARELATLHGMGHDLNFKTLKLRTVTVSQNETPSLQAHRLEIQLSEVLSSSVNVEFFFSKLD